MEHIDTRRLAIQTFTHDEMDELVDMGAPAFEYVVTQDNLIIACEKQWKYNCTKDITITRKYKSDRPASIGISGR